MQHFTGLDSSKSDPLRTPVVNESSKSAESTVTNVSNKTTVEEGRGTRTTTHLQEEKTYGQKQQVINKIITGRPADIAPILRAEGYNYEPSSARVHGSTSPQPPKSMPPREPYVPGYRLPKSSEAQFANDTSPGMTPSPTPVVGDVISSSTSSSKTRTVETVSVSNHIKFILPINDLHFLIIQRYNSYTVQNGKGWGCGNTR